MTEIQNSKLISRLPCLKNSGLQSETATTPNHFIPRPKKVPSFFPFIDNMQITTNYIQLTTNNGLLPFSTTNLCLQYF